MKIVLQCVSRASVTVDGVEISAISRGLLLLVGIAVDDDESVLRPMAEKISTLRIFPNAEGRFDRSLRDIDGELLLVSQFTLFGDTNKGRRPEFVRAMPGEPANLLFSRFVELFRELGFAKVQTGKFGAHMLVSLENEGPVTLTLETPPKK